MKGRSGLPAQALFEQRRPQVRLRQATGAGFFAHDVKLVRRGESQVVIDGVEGRRTGGDGQSRSEGRQKPRKAAGSAAKAVIEVNSRFKPRTVARDLGAGDFVEALANLRAQKTRTAADGARHRLRRRLGDRHAGHRRRRARGVAAVHRAAGRAQHPGRFAAGHERRGAAAAAAQSRRA